MSTSSTRYEVRRTHGSDGFGETFDLTIFHTAVVP
jgi:hypothetical protein